MSFHIFPSYCPFWPADMTETIVLESYPLPFRLSSQLGSKVFREAYMVSPASNFSQRRMREVRTVHTSG